MRHHLLYIFFFIPFFFLSALNDNLPPIPVTNPAGAELGPLGTEINGPYVEYTPFITPDEKLLFFESNRPGGVGQTGDFDLWYATRLSEPGEKLKFSQVVNVGRPVNTPEFDGLPSLRLLPDGSFELYFTSFSSDSRPGGDKTNIYVSRRQGETWSTPKPVIEINTDFHDRMPSISPDGRYLYFSSNRPGGYGKDDIWISEYDSERRRWGKPYNPGGLINSSASEVSPSIHSDGITVYFSTNRRGGVGGYDIYVTQMLQNSTGSKNWKRPQNLGKPYNSPQDDEYPTVIRNGNYMYFTSNRAGGRGSFDIYRARVPEFAKPEVVITMTGRVHERSSMKGIEANMRITGIDGERNISTGLPDGNYSVDFINDRKYRILITAPGYIPVEHILDLSDRHRPDTINRNFPMVRELNMPENFNVNIRFVNSEGDELQPDATYLHSPDMLSERILPLEKGSYSIQVPGSERFQKSEDAVKYWQISRLQVNARKKGYKDLNSNLSLSEVINLDKRPLQKSYELVLKMQKKGESTDNGNVVIGDEDGTVATVYFPLNVSDKFVEKDYADLKKVVKMWQNDESRLVYVHGHTDSTGSRGRNIVLSKARAMFVKNLLAKYGIPRAKIQPNWHADKKPAVRETDEASRQKNRRVEIRFSKGEENAR